MIRHTHQATPFKYNGIAPCFPPPPPSPNAEKVTDSKHLWQMEYLLLDAVRHIGGLQVFL